MIVLGQTQPSPIQKIPLQLDDGQTVDLHIKREDLLDAVCSGNKYRKLKYNLTHALAHNKRQIASFGGPFSNHLYALAKCCYHFDLQLIALVRGENDRDNPCLRFLTECGSQLHFVNRDDYRKKDGTNLIGQWRKRFSKAYFIDEGGTNELAIYGVRECMGEILKQSSVKWDIIATPFGTGGTAAGLLMQIPWETELWVFSVLKDLPVKSMIRKYLPARLSIKLDQVRVFENYHFGGFAKWNDELIRFINRFAQDNKIALDPLYTGKMFWGVKDLMAADPTLRLKNILIIHTGGLAGRIGFNYRFPGRLHLI